MSNNNFYVDIMALHKGVTGSFMPIIVHFPNKEIRTIVVDCGLFQEGEESNELNKILPFDVHKIDHVLVTHNHVDHIGRLPFLIKNGYKGKIHVSNATSQLIRYALDDSCKVLASRAKLSGAPPIYGQQHVKDTLTKIVSHNYEQCFLLEDNIKVTFFMNGHLPGAVIILLQINPGSCKKRKYEPINLLFTGDYNFENMFFDVKPIPKRIYDWPITIIQEATYGKMDSSEIKPCFEENFFSALKAGKTIILPVFSLGRGQELKYILKKYQDLNLLDTSIPIFSDGTLMSNYDNIFHRHGLDNRVECRNFYPQNYTDISGNTDLRRRIVENNSQKIILAAGGMGSHGPAQFYIPEYLRRSNALIHFTGYCAEGTLGRKLYECENGNITEASGLQVKKLADVQFTSEFSAHAKADQLIDFLRPFEKLKLLLINHGEPDTKEVYAARVINDINPKNVGILGTHVFRVDSYGLVKSYSPESYL